MPLDDQENDIVAEFNVPLVKLSENKTIDEVLKLENSDQSLTIKLFWFEGNVQISQKTLASNY